jgi:hypothetical protein
MALTPVSERFVRVNGIDVGLFQIRQDGFKERDGLRQTGDGGAVNGYEYSTNVKTAPAVNDKQHSPSGEFGQDKGNEIG